MLIFAEDYQRRAYLALREYHIRRNEQLMGKRPLSDTTPDDYFEEYLRFIIPSFHAPSITDRIKSKINEALVEIVALSEAVEAATWIAAEVGPIFGGVAQVFDIREA